MLRAIFGKDLSQQGTSRVRARLEETRVSGDNACVMLKNFRDHRQELISQFNPAASGSVASPVVMGLEEKNK